MSISQLIVQQGQDVTKVEKFIKQFGDETTYRKWGFFETYGRNTFLLVELCGDFIVCVDESSQYQMGYKISSGVGHEITMRAWDIDMTRVWDLGYLLSYRDQRDSSKDRQGAYPKKITNCALCADGNLSVEALMPSGTERTFLLSLRPPKS